MPPRDDGRLVWMIAGEPSGDQLGARLAAALAADRGRRIRVVGVGGEAMAAEGVASLFPMSDISVMGLFEVLPRLRLIRRRIRQTVRQILADRPDAVVTIDSPGFCGRIWRGLEGAGIPLAHYVAPSVWAWRPGRAAKCAARLDRMIALLPFEPPLFEREGLACTFAGHPVLESGAGSGDGAAFRARFAIPAGAPVVCVLAGSRRGEIARLMPVFRDAARRVARAKAGAVFAFPALPHLAGVLSARLEGWPGRVVVAAPADKFDAMAASDAAMAASGTVSLELAMAGVPHAVAYRLNPATHAVAARLAGKGPSRVNLVNILLGREVVPEFVGPRCRAGRVAAAVLRLLDDGRARREQTRAAADALAMLRPDAGPPSRAAAAVVAELLEPRPGQTLGRSLAG